MTKPAGSSNPGLNQFRSSSNSIEAPATVNVAAQSNTVAANSGSSSIEVTASLAQSGNPDVAPHSAPSRAAASTTRATKAPQKRVPKPKTKKALKEAAKKEAKQAKLRTTRQCKLVFRRVGAADARLRQFAKSNSPAQKSQATTTNHMNGRLLMPPPYRRPAAPDTTNGPGIPKTEK
ncbi:hypothetical protein RUND412_011137 [Rhizina undulata]